jgi:2-polyprenyl-3-methyl-5-hydroxy-6-metoxy-1,4-benzoquinol methylase
MQLNFVKDKLGDLNRKQILDIGCATGELAFQLAESGANVTGIDLNEDLLQHAQQNKKHAGLAFRKGNMLDLDTDFDAESFDGVLCFGNTLVHLQSADLVHKMIKAAYAILKPGGQFLIQILNYDYIVGEQVSTLPIIDTEQIKFIRKYNFRNNSDLIGFKTDLEIKAENKTVSNETPLLALKSKTLQSILDLVGFKNVQLYANFKQDSFGGKHIPFVLSCSK